MEYSEEVQRLAETLKSSGLVASMRDALERAQNILSDKEVRKEEHVKKTMGIEQTTLSEVKVGEEKEVIEESSEVQEGLKGEEVFTNKADSAAEEKQEMQKKVDSREKKVDLSEVFNVNK